MDIMMELMVMSGVEDGTVLKLLSKRGDGDLRSDCWTISIGRIEESDVRIGSDTYVSRKHARIHWRDKQWWLEDCKSRNGTFIIAPGDFFEDSRVQGIIPIEVGQLFRIGRTWLRIHRSE
jgi:pSer/pThr/pTyr-binding forkhead associated (FHA) protein